MTDLANKIRQLAGNRDKLLFMNEMIKSLGLENKYKIIPITKVDVNSEFFIERKNLYKRIINAAKIMNVRVTITEVDGLDEDGTEFIQYDDDSGLFHMVHDDYSSGLLTEQQVEEALLNLELQYYSIVQVDYKEKPMKWEFHEKINKKDIPKMRDYMIHRQIFNNKGSDYLIEKYNDSYIKVKLLPTELIRDKL